MSFHTNSPNFDSLEHEVLYEFFNAVGIADKTKFDSITHSGASFEKVIEKINNFSANTGDFFIFNTKHELFGYIFISFKRIIRKILRWYINPIIDRQNKYNAMVIEILKIMNKNNEELRNEITVLRKKMNNIEE